MFGESSRASLNATLSHTPAVKAALIQVGAFFVTAGFVYLLPRISPYAFTLTSAALFQGALAGLLSRTLRLATWWTFIQAVFPIALLAMLSFELPPAFALSAFLFLLGLYWSTFRTQVPFYPSGRPVWEAVVKLLPKKEGVRAIDIGSGLGGLVLHLARTRKDGEFTGIELAPLPWLLSVLRASLSTGTCRFVRDDYTRIDLADYDVVFAYLSPAAMPSLWCKAKEEMRPGSVLLSYEFDIPDAEADFRLQPKAGGPVLYGWRF